MESEPYPSKVEETLFVDPINVMMVDVVEGLDTKVDEVSMLDYTEQMKVVYPKAEEEWINFLNSCKIKGSKVMLCPC